MQRSSFLAVFGLFLLFTAAQGDEPKICGKGWEFDRAELRWPDWINAEKQQTLRAAGSLQGPNGWIQFDIDIPEAGWYELYIGGTPPEWSRDLFVDGRTEVRLGVSDGKRDRRETEDKRKPLYKEVNLFLTQGKHTLRFRRRGFPGALPGVWELHPAAGNPAGCIRARVQGNEVSANTAHGHDRHSRSRSSR